MKSNKSMAQWIKNHVAERIMPELLDAISDKATDLVGNMVMQPENEKQVEAAFELAQYRIIRAVINQLEAESNKLIK